MIETMKKVHLLAPAADGESLVHSLESLGVLHIISQEGQMIDADVSLLEDRIHELRKISQELNKRQSQGVAIPPGITAPSGVEALVAEAHQAFEEEIQCLSQQDALSRDLDLLQPWGERALEEENWLEQAGLVMSRHRLSSKAFASADFSQRTIEVIRQDKNNILFVEFRLRDEVEHPLFPEEPLPTKSIRALQDELDKVKRFHESLLGRIAAFATQNALLEAELGELEQRKERRLALMALGEEADGALVHLQGFVPESALYSLETAMAHRDVVAEFSTPEQGEAVPVRLRNGAFAKLFEPITRIFGLPQYLELDPTPFFAPFFALFFGLCLADVGYGMVVTMGALVAMLALKGKDFRPLATLLAILGITTMLGGFLFNTGFGVKINGLPLPQGIQRMVVFTDLNATMAFALLLGVLQLILGFSLQMANAWRRGGMVEALQPFGTLLVLLGAVMAGVGFQGSAMTVGPIPLGFWFALLGEPIKIGLIVAFVGVVLILFFNHPAMALWKRPLLGLWEMYGLATGLPGDILSYIRIFALSLAGGLLGGAINLIAMMIRGENPGVFSWIAALVVLVLGHGINFILAALGAFVHPLRLTFVEFYKSVGFVGGGQPYAPFGGNAS